MSSLKVKELGESCTAVSQSVDNTGETKKVPTKVALEEEDFHKELTNIVRRDFFPDLERLEKEFEGGEAGTNNSSTGEEGGEEHSKPELRLDEFLSRYESEDDASFTDMLIKASEAHRQKHAWLHQQETLKQLPSQEVPPAIAGPAESSRRAGLDSWGYTAKNSLMYIPDGVERSAVESIRRGSNLTRKILHSNTRLPEEFKFKRPSNSLETKKPVQEKVGVDGKVVLTVDESPKVNGYGFLSTPQINPGVDSSPLMTWGSIEGTPVRLDTDCTPGPSFKMPKVPTRERIALKLADQVAKTSRQRRKKSSATPSPLLRGRSGTTPSKSDHRLRLLSPAARKLIGRRTNHSGRALSTGYSPQVGNIYKIVKTPGTTPKSTPVVRHHTPSSSSLTDNLLDIKK